MSEKERGGRERKGGREVWRDREGEGGRERGGGREGERERGGGRERGGEGEGEGGRERERSGGGERLSITHNFTEMGHNYALPLVVLHVPVMYMYICRGFKSHPKQLIFPLEK